VYAVIEVAGKQFKVTKGRWILIDQPEEQDVVARVLMFSDGKTVTTDRAKLDKCVIKTSKQGTHKEDLGRVMKFKPKQGRTSKRTLGHRRVRTRVMIDELKLS
jgi:ribosomal protein L21